jgi:hypothetical protein
VNEEFGPRCESIDRLLSTHGAARRVIGFRHVVRQLYCIGFQLWTGVVHGVPILAWSTSVAMRVEGYPRLICQS